MSTKKLQRPPGTSRTSVWRRRRKMSKLLHELSLSMSNLSESCTVASTSILGASSGTGGIVTEFDQCPSIPSISDNVTAVEETHVSVTAPLSLREDIRQTFSGQLMSHAAMRAVLQCLNRHFSDIPKDPRTLLCTPRTNVTHKLSNGTYIHFGFRDVLSNVVCATDIPELRLQLNIDGMSVFRDSEHSIWCIQARVCHPMVGSPFVIGVFFGRGKPTNQHDFLRPSVEELRSVISSGIQIAGRTVTTQVSISAVICDSPARAYVRGTKLCTSYFGCDKCMDKGQSVAGCVRFLHTNAAIRTHENFVHRNNPEHHASYRSLFETLPTVNMIAHFPLEPMHLVYLGVCKKILSIWFKTPNNANVMREISEKLQACRSALPCDFQRKCRSLDKFDRWKATECRQFMLYLGVVVLHKSLPDAQYKNFLHLFCAIYCLSHHRLFRYYLPFCKSWLKRFFVQFRDLYEPKNVVPNIHGLLHLCADVDLHGPLDDFSAFAFESYLGRLRSRIHGTKNPAVQLYRRLSEAAIVEQSTQLLDPKDDIGLSLKRVPSAKSRFMHRNTIFTDCQPDCNAIIGGRAVEIVGISNLAVTYRQYEEQESFFTTCLDSSHINIVRVRHVTSNLYNALKSEIVCKCMRLPIDDRYVYIPLLHTT